jgi:tRNA(Ile2) C34 agmatinyltransferase TiaS
MKKCPECKGKLEKNIEVYFRCCDCDMYYEEDEI